MADHNQIFPIEKMSAVFKVSRSGYYRRLSSPPSPRATNNQQLKGAIHRVWEASGRCYGSPRIHQQLLAEGWSVSRQRIARLMAKMGIASQIRRKWVAKGLTANLTVLPAWKAACQRRPITGELIFHSDRGHPVCLQGVH